MPADLIKPFLQVVGAVLGDLALASGGLDGLLSDPTRPEGGRKMLWRVPRISSGGCPLVSRNVFGSPAVVLMRGVGARWLF